MNFPNLTFWSNLLGTVGLEVCAVVALGVAAQCAFRRAYWKRAMWQMALLSLILISASEWTGAGRGAVLSQFGKKRIEQTIAPQTLSSNIQFYPTKTIPAVLPPLPAPQKPIWWPGLIWLAGIVIVLGRMMAAQGLLLLLRFRREKIVDSDMQERVAGIAKMLGLRRKVCLLRLPESISPMAFGILFPTIGLPPRFETGFSAIEQDAILAHELAHLAALDPLWFRLSDFASAILWWHPLAWWARRSLHGASELAADEATALVPDGPGSLAHCLVSLGKKMTVSRGWGWTGINGGFRSKLGKRVERLTHLSPEHGRPFVGWRDRLMRIAAMLLIVPSIVLLFGAFQTAKGEKENAWRNSWNSSPGALLAMAALDSTENPIEKEKIAERVTDAKLLYEKGNLEESKKILTQVLKDDPSNAKAAYYLNLIKEAQFMDRARKRSNHWDYVEGPHTAKPPARNPPPQNFPDNPTSQPMNVSTQTQDAIVFRPMDKPSQQKAMLAQVLEDLTKDAESAERSRKGVPSEIPLATNEHHQAVSPGREAILSKLENIRLEKVQYDLPLTDVLSLLRTESQKHDSDGTGINFLINPHVDAAPVGHFLPNTNGTSPPGSMPVLAPAPQVDMGIVTIKIPSDLTNARLIDVLDEITMTADQPITYTIKDYGVVFSPASSRLRSQITIEGKFVDLPEEEGKKRGFGAFLQKSVLSDKQFRTALDDIENKSHADVLAVPRVTTLSGREARVSSTNSNGDGPVLDVIAMVGADGFSIEISVTASFTEKGQKWEAVEPSIKIRDSQTLVMGQLVSSINPDARKLRLVFVTPTIIDAAGNRVHSDEELQQKP